jgi:alkyldihydroxyacetonephosphate synthase
MLLLYKRDTKFQFGSEQICEVTGDRYKISGHKLPLLRDWFISVIGASLDRRSPAQPEMTADQIPNVIINEPFMLELKQTQIAQSDDPQDRLFRAHG